MNQDLPSELKSFNVIKTIHGLSGKTVAELNNHYVQNIWTDTGLEIKSGVFYSEGVTFYVTKQPWEDEIVINKKVK